MESQSAWPTSNILIHLSLEIIRLCSELQGADTDLYQQLDIDMMMSKHCEGWRVRSRLAKYRIILYLGDIECWDSSELTKNLTMSFMFYISSSGMLLLNTVQCSCYTFLEHDSFLQNQRSGKKFGMPKCCLKPILQFSIFLLVTWRAMQDKLLSGIILHVYWKKNSDSLQNKNQISIVYPNIRSINCRNIQFLLTQFLDW